ncbi:MAG: c-type cytochrome [Nannocystaceae bacterium]
MRQFRIIDLVAASSIALMLGGAACDGGDQAKPEPAKQEAKPDEAKPEATKPDEAKPEAVKPDEAKPDEAKPDEANPDEAKPDEAAPDEAKPDEAAPEEKTATKTEKKAPAKTEKAPASNVDVKGIFASKCKSCHGEDGRGKTKFAEKTPVPDLTGTKLSTTKIGDIISNGVADTKMKGFKEKLSKDEITALAGYVKKL